MGGGTREPRTASRSRRNRKPLAGRPPSGEVVEIAELNTGDKCLPFIPGESGNAFARVGGIRNDDEFALPGDSDAGSSIADA